jgi:hypothetical protein
MSESMRAEPLAIPLSKPPHPSSRLPVVIARSFSNSPNWTDSTDFGRSHPTPKQVPGVHPSNMRFAAVAAFVAAASQGSQVTAWEYYNARIPNGYNVTSAAFPNGGVNTGHLDQAGETGYNKFGSAFRSAKKKWTVALCQADSDGDGQTNGQELGDPCCEFNVTTYPMVRWTIGVSNPGDNTSVSNPSLWASIVCPTLTPTATPTPTPTPTSTPTTTATVTPTSTPASTVTVAPTSTPTTTVTVAPTSTPVTTVTPTPTPTPTSTPTTTVTVAPTSTPASTVTRTPTSTPCPLPTVVQVGGNCGNDATGALACKQGAYCQPWNPWYYQCIAKPANCGAPEVDVDYYGDDLQTIKDVQPEECCDRCLALAKCTAYTFVNYNADGRSACYLKSGSGSKKALKGAVSAIVTTTKPTCSNKIGASCGDASGTVCCPSGSYCQPWNQWYYQCIATPKQCSKQKTNVDFYGHDLSVKYGLSPDQCCDECSATSDCVAYTFVNDNPGRTACYLKSSTAGETRKVGAISAVVNERA